MPAISISAVNTGTDTLTATAHGLVTGDRFRVRNTGGALPTGLSGVTDYFAVRVDANNLKAATSSANALAGTPVVDITGAGSGTNTVEYGLPYCIPTVIAAAGGQIKSANDNGAWNALVALYDLLTGQSQSVFSDVRLAVNVASSLTVVGNFTAPGVLLASTRALVIGGCQFVLNTGSPTRSDNVWTMPTGTAVVSSFRLPTGCVISDAVFSINRNSSAVASGEFQMDILRRSFGNGGSTSATVASELSGTGATTWTTKSLAVDLPHTVLADTMYLIKVSTNGSFDASPLFDGCKLVIDRL